MPPGPGRFPCVKGIRPYRSGMLVLGRAPSPVAMEIVLASNFDDALVERTRDLPVASLFGSFPYQITGGGRPPHILPSVTREEFHRHLRSVHAAGRTFYATLNSSDLGLKEYRPGFLPAFLRAAEDLLDLGVDGFVIAIPALVDALHRAHPEVPITVSSFARIRTVTQAEYYQRLGADTVVLEEANRDFALIRGLVRIGLRVEVLVNQSCIPSCPYRFHHLNTSSLSSQFGEPCPLFEFPIVECGLEYVRTPWKLIASVFIRPEDLEVYEEEGVHRFKISGRNHATPWLVKVAQAYAGRKYEGNLLDILSYVQVRGPRSALATLADDPREPQVVRAFTEAFAPLADVVIDNTRFPPGFLRRIATMDCEHRSCSQCGYCRSVAEKVLRIRGVPPSAYHPPEGLPEPEALLPLLGPASP